MSITMRCGGLGVAQKIPDDGKAQRCPGANAGEAVAQVVNAEPGQIRRGADCSPWLGQVGARSVRVLAWDHMRVVSETGYCGQDFERGRRQVDRLFSSFAVRQVKHSALQIHVAPLRMQDFAQSSASQDKQPDGSNRERVYQPPPILRCVLDNVLAGLDRLFALSIREAHVP